MTDINDDRAISGGTEMVYGTGDPSQWDPSFDAMASGTANHTVLLENEHVRVLEVVIPAGTKEDPHHHQWPSLIVMLEMENFVDRTAAGEVIFDTRELREKFTLPAAIWKEPEALHSVESVSKTTPVHLIRVELKQ